MGLNCYKMRPIFIKDSKCELFLCSKHGQLLAHRHVGKTVSHTKHYYGICNEVQNEGFNLKQSLWFKITRSSMCEYMCMWRCMTHPPTLIDRDRETTHVYLSQLQNYSHTSVTCTRDTHARIQTTVNALVHRRLHGNPFTGIMSSSSLVPQLG